MNDGKDMHPRPASQREEREIDRVLGLASRPGLPKGAGARLLARIEAVPQVARPAAQPLRMPVRRSPLRYAAALPLAASLALGVYLGAQGSLDFMLPSAITGELAQGDEVVDELGGVGEAEAYAEESLS